MLKKVLIGAAAAAFALTLYTPVASACGGGHAPKVADKGKAKKAKKVADKKKATKKKQKKATPKKGKKVSRR